MKIFECICLFPANRCNFAPTKSHNTNANMGAAITLWCGVAL